MKNKNKNILIVEGIGEKIFFDIFDNFAYEHIILNMCGCGNTLEILKLSYALKKKIKILLDFDKKNTFNNLQSITKQFTYSYFSENIKIWIWYKLKNNILLYTFIDVIRDLFTLNNELYMKIDKNIGNDNFYYTNLNNCFVSAKNTVYNCIHQRDIEWTFDIDKNIRNINDKYIERYAVDKKIIDDYKTYIKYIDDNDNHPIKEISVKDLITLNGMSFLKMHNRLKNEMYVNEIKKNMPILFIDSIKHMLYIDNFV